MATNKDFIVKNGLSVGEDISVSGSVTSNLQFDDSVQLQLGTDSDLLVYHDGSHARLRELTGEFRIQTTSGGVNAFVAKQNAEVELFHAGGIKLATTATGVDITGNANITGNAVLTGELRGPATFTIDPAAIGDNTGEVVIKGDLTVEGTTTTVNSTTLDVADKNITLNHGSGDTSTTANGAGITIQDAVSASTDATILWNTTNDRFDFSHPVSVTGNINASGDIIGSSSLQIFRSAAGAASVLLQRNGAAGPWSLAQGNTSTDYFEILEGTNTRMTIANGGATTFPGNLTSNGTITGADFSGITMGGSLTGSHDDAKVQYGTSFVGTAAQGHFFFDSLNQKLKVYTGSAFVDAVPASGGGGGGSGSSDATATFRKYTYTLTGTTNAISGKEDDEVTTGDFISGRLYEITAVGNTDFTAIGASSNAIGVQFTATDVGGGTTGKAKEVLFYATGGTQNIEVYVNGVKAVEGSSNDYVATTGTSVTFTSNLVSGDVVDIQVYELLTNDSYYLKTETYTQAQVVAGFVAKSGDTMTGNLTVEKSANPTLTVTEPNAGAVTIQGTGSGGRVYSNASNKLLLGANGQNAHIIVNTTGTVGIGAGTNPTSKLQVEGSMGTTPLVLMKSLDTTANDGAVLKLDASGRGGGIVDIDIFGVHNYDGGVFHIRNNGFVGIGTDSPDYLVHAENSTSTDPSYIATSANGQFVMAMGSQNSPNVAQEAFIGTLSDTRFKIKVNTVTKGSWTDTGLAIGTQSSAYADLDVAGEIAMSVGNAHAVFSSDASGKIYIKANENAVNASTAIHMQMPLISGSGTLEDKLVINHSDITAYKNVLPNANATLDLGSSTLAWRNVYTNDLHLSNEGHEEGNSVDGTKGNWTIQEGEEHLYIINNKSGKKYKFALEEIE